MIRVKICGITNVADGQAAAQAGADAVGLICHASSKRLVDIEKAHEIARSLPSFVMPVLLFENAAEQVVRSFSQAVPWATLQFHGNETAAFCAAFDRPYLVSCHPQQASDFDDAARAHPDAAALLLDAKQGGSGTTFDWSAVPPVEQRKAALIVAGGLHPNNVADAIAATDPYGVDVSSGVCSDSDPRRKDPDLIEAFVAAARNTSV